jgi:hypothetical protein
VAPSIEGALRFEAARQYAVAAPAALVLPIMAVAVAVAKVKRFRAAPWSNWTRRTQRKTVNGTHPACRDVVGLGNFAGT